MELLRSAIIPQAALDRPALIGPRPNSVFTYAELASAAARFTAVVEKGNSVLPKRVGVMLPAGPEFAVAAVAVLRWGGAVAPIDPTLRGQSLTDAILALQPDLLVVRLGCAEAMRGTDDLPPPYGLECSVIDGQPFIIVDSGAGGRRRQLVEPVADTDELPVLDDLSHPEADALLLSTSGTTGRPKFVRLSHRAVARNIGMHLASFGLADPFTALQLLPVNYSYGLVASFLSTLVAGGTLVFPEHPDRKHVRQAIDVHQPEVCLGTPAIFRHLLENSPPEFLEAFRTLGVIGIGGDACPPPQREALRAALPDSRIHVTYGTTECGPRVTTLPSDMLVRKPTSIGRPFPEVRIEIRTEEGHPCRQGEVGYLHIQTPSLMTGYLNPEGPSEVLRPDHWYKTGDLAVIDEDGCIQLHGRADRQWKFRGRRVNPTMIERCLTLHPSVLHARAERVVEGDTEKVRVVVHHRPGVEPTFLRELTNLCRANLPSYLIPDELSLHEDEQVYFKGKRWSGHTVEAASAA